MKVKKQNISIIKFLLISDTKFNKKLQIFVFFSRYVFTDSKNMEDQAITLKQLFLTLKLSDKNIKYSLK